MCIICTEYEAGRMTISEVRDAISESYNHYKDVEHTSEKVQEIFDDVREYYAGDPLKISRIFDEIDADKQQTNMPSFTDDNDFNPYEVFRRIPLNEPDHNGEEIAPGALDLGKFAKGLKDDHEAPKEVEVNAEVKIPPALKTLFPKDREEIKRMSDLDRVLISAKEGGYNTKEFYVTQKELNSLNRHHDHVFEVGSSIATIIGLVTLRLWCVDSLVDDINNRIRKGLAHNLYERGPEHTWTPTSKFIKS